MLTNRAEFANNRGSHAWGSKTRGARSQSRVQNPQIQGVMAESRLGPIPISWAPEGIDMVKKQHSAAIQSPGMAVAKDESRLEVDQIISSPSFGGNHERQEASEGFWCPS